MEIQDDLTLTSNGNKWVYFKFKIREVSIRFGKQKNKEQKKKELILIQEINTGCNMQVLSHGDLDKLLSLQANLDNLCIMKAQGAFVQSHAKWLEEGEKNTAYFCQLEKRRQKNNAVNSLIVNEKVITDPN